MISICIPIYNFDVNRLVSKLAEQIKNCSQPTEIVLIDDCSSDEFKNLNVNVCKNHKYIELEKNVGRAKIRNLFLAHASFDCLLFLDCDSLIISNQFIQQYIDAYVSSNSKVICGGRVYDNSPPSKNQKLSWKYGVKRESKPIEVRKNNPYSSFMTNNFLVEKMVLIETPFDERLSNYGHEDTLFGYYLKHNKISILQIDNPILNGEIEENLVYLRKTELAIENLEVILSIVENKKAFCDEVTLLTYYQKLKNKGKIKIILFLAKFLNPLFLFLLSIDVVSLTLFNFYKLAYFSKVMNKKKG